MCKIMANEDKTNLQHYIEIVQKVARVEHRRIPSHMVEYEELLSIGIIAIQVMIKNKTPEQLAKYNSAYIATAVRWAIRNELRIRYKWYSLKHKSEDEYDEEEAVEGMDMKQAKVREAIYETILSIDGLAAAASDNDSPFDFPESRLHMLSILYSHTSWILIYLRCMIQQVLGRILELYMQQ